MSHSTDGIVFFGIDLEDEHPDNGPEWMEAGENWENHYLRKKGCVDTSGFYNAEGGYTFKGGTKEWEEAEKIKNEYWELKRSVLAACPIEIGYHCSSEMGVPYVYLKRTRVSNSRGYHQVLDPESMKVTPEEIQQLKDFCEFMEIQWQEPKWLLVSYEG